MLQLVNPSVGVKLTVREPGALSIPIQLSRRLTDVSVSVDREQHLHRLAVENWEAINEYFL